MKFTPPSRNSISQQMDDNMIPLINVVFLMLIFFMAAGQIRKADPVDIVPPSSINEKQAESEANVVLVVKNDLLFADDEAILLDKLSVYLTTRFENSVSPETFWIQIKADGAMTVEALTPVFAQIKASGLTKVTLSTQLIGKQ